MVTLARFIKEEVNDHIRNVILETINTGKLNDKTMDELSFNRYSIEIDYTKQSIIIYDDIFSDDEPLNIQLKELLLALKQSKRYL